MIKSLKLEVGGTNLLACLISWEDTVQAQITAASLNQIIQSLGEI